MSENMNFDLIIKNAQLTSYNEAQAKVITEKSDIGVLNGKISFIGYINSHYYSPDSTNIIDARNLHVLPGVIDSQVHFREPGMTHKEDIESGSKSAILGGVTTFFEMPNTNPPTISKERLEEKLNLSYNRAHSNFAYFIGGSAENIDQLAELEKLPHCSGIKIFLGSSFGTLLINNDDLLEKVFSHGRRRLVIHSEDETRLNERKHIAIEAQHPRVHHIWRDEESALITTRKSVALAEKYKRPIHVLHISSSEEMAFLKEHKQYASVEILPQYLTLSAPECYERLGTLAQQNPPIRDQRHMEFLWKAVLDGTVDVIGSDHAPHTLEEKQKPYPQSPSGVPGVQTLVPIMLNHVNQEKLSLEKFVELVTENPRRLFGLKNKGRLQVGYDADFTLIDLKRTETITKSWLASKVGWSPFENQKVKGWPVMSIIKGDVIMSEAQILKPHSGQACNFE